MEAVYGLFFLQLFCRSSMWNCGVQETKWDINHKNDNLLRCCNTSLLQSPTRISLTLAHFSPSLFKMSPQNILHFLLVVVFTACNLHRGVCIFPTEIHLRAFFFPLSCTCLINFRFLSSVKGRRQYRAASSVCRARACLRHMSRPDLHQGHRASLMIHFQHGRRMWMRATSFVPPLESPYVMSFHCSPQT